MDWTEVFGPVQRFLTERLRTGPNNTGFLDCKTQSVHDKNLGPKSSPSERPRIYHFVWVLLSILSILRD